MITNGVIVKGVAPCLTLVENLALTSVKTDKALCEELFAMKARAVIQYSTKIFNKLYKTYIEAAYIQASDYTMFIFL